jgi:pyridoxal phosphate enzyme (YggS family)
MITIAERLDSAYGRIKQATNKSNRSEQSITLLAVSKTKPISLILDAYEAGHRKFGESYVQESVEKIEKMAHLNDIQWHFIGPIQSNKTKLIAQNFNWVQSIDRLKIAKRLNEQRPSNLKPLNILIQVNISNEASKSGCSIEEVNNLAQSIMTLDNLKLRGLMAIPAKKETVEQQIEDFTMLKTCFEALQTQYKDIDTLSMGMSADLEPAIAAGSTMVRIGTDIFGARS